MVEGMVEGPQIGKKASKRLLVVPSQKAPGDPSPPNTIRQLKIPIQQQKTDTTAKNTMTAANKINDSSNY